MFTITSLEKQSFAIRLSMSSTHYLEVWSLVVVYGPCRQPARDNFVNWLYSLDFEDDDLWLLVGDFIYRSTLIEIDQVAILMTP